MTQLQALTRDTVLIAQARTAQLDAMTRDTVLNREVRADFVDTEFAVYIVDGSGNRLIDGLGNFFTTFSAGFTYLIKTFIRDTLFNRRKTK